MANLVSNFKIGETNYEIKDSQARKNIKEIIEKNNNQDEKIMNIENLANGTPLVASSIENMTDTTKIYINSTDGNWYYYNGTNWVIGGVYQASQISNKSITKNHTNFMGYGKNRYNKNTVTEGFYFAYGSGTKFENEWFCFSEFIKVNPNTKLALRYTTEVQICFYDINYNYISGLAQSGIEETNGIITTPENCEFIIISMDKRKTNEQQLELGEVKTKYEPFYNTIDNFKSSEIEIPNNYVKPEMTNFIKKSKNIYNKKTVTNGYYYMFGSGTKAENSLFCYSEMIPVDPETEYVINNYKNSEGQICFYDELGKYLSGTTVNETKTPNGVFTTPTNCYFMIVSIPFKYKEEFMIEEGNVSTSYKPFGYEIPELLSETSKVYHVGENQEYTKLSEAILEAVNYKNSIVYVNKGTYDLYEELGGAEFFDTYSPLGTLGGGLPIKNGIHIIFDAKSKVLFNYPGTKNTVLVEFSPFNTGAGGGTIENMTLECSNCRYCIHDDRQNTYDSYTNKFINCNLSIDNSNNPSWGNTQTIGGGLGYSGNIEIKDCKCSGSITYHGNPDTTVTDSTNNLNITNNYIKAGTIGISGNRTDLTGMNYIMVSNNSVSNNLELPTVDNEHFKVISYNNNVRN